VYLLIVISTIDIYRISAVGIKTASLRTISLIAGWTILMGLFFVAVDIFNKSAYNKVRK